MSHIRRTKLRDMLNGFITLPGTAKSENNRAIRSLVLLPSNCCHGRVVQIAQSRHGIGFVEGASRRKNNDTFRRVVT